MSTQWSTDYQLHWCALCCEYRVSLLTAYTCPVCHDDVYEGRRTIAITVPAPRMAFDPRPQPISTTSGDVA